MELTGKQWMEIEPVILEPMREKDSRGRKPRDPREALNGILWVLRTGAYRRQLCSGKKRGAATGRTKRGEGSRIMAIADAADLASASPHEVKLAEKAIDNLFIGGKPGNLIGGKAA